MWRPIGFVGQYWLQGGELVAVNKAMGMEDVLKVERKGWPKTAPLTYGAVREFWPGTLGGI